MKPAAILKVLIEANTSQATRSLLRFRNTLEATESQPYAGLPQKDLPIHPKRKRDSVTVSTPTHQIQKLGFPSVLKVPCPTCNQKAGEPCLPMSTLVPHLPRFEAARKVAA